MGSKGKDIFSPEWMNSITRKGELVNKLNELHLALNKLSQETTNLPKTLKSIALNLVSSKVMGHSDRDVRLLGACCMVDIFRVFAPEAPLKDEDMIHAFEVIVNLLRGLSTHDLSSATGSKLLYILSSLATIKSCVVPIILAGNGVEGAEEVTRSMFDVLISSIRSDHNDEALAYICEILTACVEESEGVDAELLELLLSPLTPSAKLENPAAHKTISNVIRRCASHLQNSITSFVSNILINISTNSNEKLTDLAEQVYVVLYDLHKISPVLLHKVIPNLSLQLNIENEIARLKVVKLLGVLYASQFADYGEEFLRDFKEFIKRFRDLSDDIRSEMVDCGALIIKNKPNLRNLLEEHFTLALRDNDVEIRAKVLKCLLEIALENPIQLTEKSFEEICNRAVDKKIEIRKFMLIGLAKVYYRHVSLNLIPFSETNGSVDDIISEDVWVRMKSIPGVLLKSWCYPEIEYKHLIVQLIQDYILPKSFKEMNNSQESNTNKLDDYRATALLLFYSYCDDIDKKIFGQVLSFKSKVQLELNQFYNYCCDKTSSKNESSEDNKNIKRVMNRILALVPSEDKRINYLEKLLMIKDKTVFRLLNNAINQSIDSFTVMKSKDDLKQRLDSKSSISEYLEYLFNFSSYLIANGKIIKCFLNFVNEQFVHNNNQSRKSLKKRALSESVIENLLLLFANHSTLVFRNIFSDMETWLDSITLNLKSDREQLFNELEINQLNICCDIIDSAVLCVQVKSTPNDLPDIEEIYSICWKLLNTANLISNDSILCDKVAKVASRLFVGINSNSLIKSTHIFNKNNHIKSFLNSFIKSDEFNGVVDDVMTYHKNLIILASMVTIPMPNLTANKVDVVSPMICSLDEHEYKNVRSNIMNFVKENLLSEKISNDLSTDNKKMKTNHRIEMIECIGCGISILTNILISEAEALVINQADGRYSKVVEGLNTRNEIENLIVELFTCLEWNGVRLFQLQLHSHSYDTQTIVKEFASSNLFHLLKVEWIAKKFSVIQWHQLAWTLLDQNHLVRRNLFNILCNIIQTKLSLLQFLAYTCLLANDDVLKSKAESALMFAIKRLRKSHEELCVQALVENDENLRRQAEMNMPEVILPYVLHLLSYHPEFPSSATMDDDNDKKRMNHVVKSLQMVLRVLIDSVGTDTDNIPYLLKQVNVIIQHYEDKNDPDNIGLQFVAKITIKLLNEYIKTAENVQVYPGEIYLPDGLFQLKYSNFGVDVSATQMDEILETDQAINNVLQKVKGKGKNQSGTSSPGIKSLMKKTSKIDSLHSVKSRKEIKKKITPVKAGKDENDYLEDNVTQSERNETVARRSNRSKAGNVVYVEPDENDEETTEWENLAAAKSKHISPSIRKPLEEININEVNLVSNVSFRDDKKNSWLKPKKTTNKTTPISTKIDSKTDKSQENYAKFEVDSDEDEKDDDFNGRKRKDGNGNSKFKKKSKQLNLDSFLVS